MTDTVDCPVDTCSFDGSIPVVADHIAATDNEAHNWETLGHEEVDGFCHAAHLDEGRRLQDKAKEARNLGEFDVAIEKLEGTLHHFQRAKLFVVTSLENRCREVLIMIDEIETAEQVQVIDNLVDDTRLSINRSTVSNMGVAGFDARFTAATSTDWSHSTRQSILRPIPRD